MNMNKLFAKAAAGKLTSGDITSTLCKLADTSEVVRKSEERIVARHELSAEDMKEFGRKSVESIYADHDKGFTLD